MIEKNLNIESIGAFPNFYNFLIQSVFRILKSVEFYLRIGNGDKLK
ncbi:Uncharacterized protein dnm_048340 [Desulfonema magnum]|uniref:Uncharacterized protein n=1 Tax=Desulfonema magnum TaxID=45655 RepID=A0A975BP09_9BACT|nr:Uncharacterized protein dnm_048340 [Desulfonema magnum]